jgi:hypothetical protein
MPCHTKMATPRLEDLTLIAQRDKLVEVYNEMRKNAKQLKRCIKSMNRAIKNRRRCRNLSASVIDCVRVSASSQLRPHSLSGPSPKPIS